MAFSRSFMPAQARRGLALLQNSDALHTPSPTQPTEASVALALVRVWSLSLLSYSEPGKARDSWGPESASALTSLPSLGPSIPGMAASFYPSLDAGGSLQITSYQVDSSSAIYPQPQPISRIGL